MHLFIACNGVVAAIRPDDGTEVWRATLRLGVFSQTSRQDVCLLEHESRVFAGCYGYLFALDAASGEILWQNELKGLGYNEVTLAMAGKSIQIISRTERVTSSTT